MKITRIYQAGTYKEGDLIELSPEAGHHVAVVLRMQIGENISLFRGDNCELKSHSRSMLPT